MMEYNPTFKKKEFEIKDKDMAEFVAFINGKTIAQEGEKLILADSKDIEKQIRELLKNKKYLEANQLLESSKETINRKKYLESLIGTRTFSYRYSLLAYIRLINQAIIEKSNVSSIVKRDMCSTIRKYFKEHKMTSEEEKLILTTADNWEKEFKEKEWNAYNLFDIEHDVCKDQNQKFRMGSYEHACMKMIMYFMGEELKNIGLTPDEIAEFVSFFEHEDESQATLITTSGQIINNNVPQMVITIRFTTTVTSLRGYYLEEMFPHGDKILKHFNKSKPYDFFEGDSQLITFSCDLEKKIPLSDILCLKEDLTQAKLKKLLLFDNYPEEMEAPKDFEKLKKMLPIMAKYKLDEKIAEELSTILIQHSNVVTLSAPKIIPIAYRIISGKKMNR